VERLRYELHSVNVEQTDGFNFLLVASQCFADERFTRSFLCTSADAPRPCAPEIYARHSCRVKGKVTWIYLAPSHRETAEAWITQFYLQTPPYLPLHRKRSPDGATTEYQASLQSQ